MQMEILTSISAWQNWRNAIPSTQSVGLVPTMGALHAGHQSLITRCRQENDICTISLFVNPTQFNDQNDLTNYPSTFEADRKMCEAEGVDAIFFPNYSELYPDDYRYRVSESEVSRLLCGAHRPGHFDGVLSVVMKLLNLARPHRAYFGEKDWQQLQLIRGMVEAFFMPVTIVGCPTVRETDGLALSSRNAYLSSSERKAATVLYRSLNEAKTEYDKGERDADALRKAMRSVIASEPLAHEEYVSAADAETLCELQKIDGRVLLSLAVRIGKTRLIDNLLI